MNKETTIKQVRAVLEKDPRINLHRYPITIVAQNGDLILTGEVESIAAKKLALLAAADIHGVQRIVDRLKVTPAQKMGDAEIRDHMCRVLFEEPAWSAVPSVASSEMVSRSVETLPNLTGRLLSQSAAA
jgi:hypothetical protein